MFMNKEDNQAPHPTQFCAHDDKAWKHKNSHDFLMQIDRRPT